VIALAALACTAAPACGQLPGDCSGGPDCGDGNNGPPANWTAKKAAEVARTFSYRPMVKGHITKVRCRIVARQRWQCQHHDLRGSQRWRHDGWRTAWRLGRQGEEIDIDRACADAALLSIDDLAQLERMRTPAGIERDNVARCQCERTRRQREVGALASRPHILQPDICAPLHCGIVCYGGNIRM
jgi:hypothetical protein